MKFVWCWIEHLHFWTAWKSIPFNYDICICYIYLQRCLSILMKHEQRSEVQHLNVLQQSTLWLMCMIHWKICFHTLEVIIPTSFFLLCECNCLEHMCKHYFRLSIYTNISSCMFLNAMLILMKLFPVFNFFLFPRQQIFYKTEPSIKARFIHMRARLNKNCYQLSGVSIQEVNIYVL